jgi:integrase
VEGIQVNLYNLTYIVYTYMSDPRSEIERLRERIQAGERGGSEADREVLIDFSDRLFLLREEYGDHRHLKLLRHCTRMAEEVGGLHETLDDKKAAEDIVRWIHDNYDNEETNRDYRVALRVFGTRVPERDPTSEGPVPSIAWISSKTPRNYDPSPDPAEMLAKEGDVLPMIEATRNKRDAALIAVQFEAGLRGGELYDLTIGSVSDGEHGLRIRVDGKTGQRTVDLIWSVPYLQKWLADHPASDDNDAWLWSKLSDPDRYSYQRFLQCFKEAADRADVTKPVTPTNFRRSNATWLAKQGVNAALIEDRQGRERGSKAVARYVAQFGDEAEAQYAKLHGIEVDDAGPEFNAPVDCPRCTRETPADEDKCVWCGQVLNYDAIEDLRADQRDLRNAILRLAREDPEILDDFERARDMMTVFENDPELYAEAREFVDALSES